MAETLIQHLRGRQLLLVVDNCEHVIDDCAGLVDTIRRSCPGITLLATSREPLRVSGETVWRVPLLAVPDPAAPIDLRELPECEAVGLFLDRAQLAAPNFEMSAENAPAVAELCRRLEGIPLAIELAAARVGLMSPDQMLQRVQGRFGLLTGGSRTSPTRHRTLQSALDWSHDLLSDRERTLFRRLAVFEGSFSLEAAEQVCSDDDLEADAITGLLGSLVDKSLVIASGGDVSSRIRFRMLETLQQYGRERLADSGEVERLGRRHCDFFVALAEEAFPNLIGRQQQSWHQRLAQDIGNLRSALEWSAVGEPEANVRLSIALTDFWYIHGLVQEGDGWLKRSLTGYAGRDELRAKALAQGGKISYWRDDSSGYSARCNECLDIYRELGDQEGIGRALNGVGQAAEWQGDFERARHYYESSLEISRKVENSRVIADTLRFLGRLEMKEGDYLRASTFLKEGLAFYERIGDQRTTNWNLGYLGLNAIESGDFAAARSHLERALNIGRALDSAIVVAIPLMYLAALAAAQSDPTRALRLASASESLAESAGAVPVRLTRPLIERWLDQSRLELGPDLSAACGQEGRAMTRERAIEYALKG
jgi:predicted ATPase